MFEGSLRHFPLDGRLRELVRPAAITIMFWGDSLDILVSCNQTSDRK